METIDHSLEKSLLSSSSPHLSLLCAEIWRDAEAAKASLACLPFTDIDLDKTNKLISQTGQYSYTILRKSALGEPLTDEDRKNLRSLSDSTKYLSGSISLLRAEMTDSNTTFTQIGQAAAKLREENAATAPEDSSIASFQSLENELPELGSLVYDGPFSDHLQSTEASYVKDKPAVSKSRAQEIAASILSCDKNKLKDVSEGGSTIDVYTFSLPSKDSDIFIDITKNGGLPAAMFNSRPVGKSTASPQNAVEIAKKYLSHLGFKNMKESYYENFDGTLVINFAYESKDVIVYPDLIKVSVALDRGEVSGFECAGYLTNHHERKLKAATVSEKTAREKINPSLKILSYSLALIPTEGQNECFAMNSSVKIRMAVTVSSISTPKPGGKRISSFCLRVKTERSPHKKYAAAIGCRVLFIILKFCFEIVNFAVF